MTTYKQEVKETSRVVIWTKAIKKLTTDREKQRILKPNYIRRLWDYAFDEILKTPNINEDFIESWTSFSNNLYETKQPQQLKIAYFCGPEPENDLDIMVKLGILIENVWAIESNKNMYSSAILSAREKYPTLKIFNGPIAELMKVISFKFDIIYLDFTAPLFSQQAKPLLTINAVFENNSLSDLGILITNSSLPDKTDEAVEFLSSYFRSHAWLESSVFTGTDNECGFYEGADCHGYFDREQVKEWIEEDPEEDYLIFEDLIKENFEFAYSAFATHYPTIVASCIQPMFRVASSPALKRMFLKMDDSQILSSIKKMTEIKNYEETDENLPDTEDHSSKKPEQLDFSGGEVFESHEDFPFWNFLLRLKESKTKLCQYWYQQFSKKSGSLSYQDCVQLYDLLRYAEYAYKDTLSENLSNSIKEIIKALPDRRGGVFCDVPMPHLWIELALNHLGNSHHINTDEHWRAKYKAKTRDMYLDMFVFDNCRALYDWLPMVDLYGKDTATIERQIIIRSCMDAITKQNHYSSFTSYYGANLIGIGTKRWSDFGELKERQSLNKK